MDLLTLYVNVPAEREKLRRLRNVINAQAQIRLEYERKYTARGYRRAQLPEQTYELPNLQTRESESAR